MCMVGWFEEHLMGLWHVMKTTLSKTCEPVDNAALSLFYQIRNVNWTERKWIEQNVNKSKPVWACCLTFVHRYVVSFSLSNSFKNPLPALLGGTVTWSHTVFVSHTRSCTPQACVVNMFVPFTILLCGYTHLWQTKVAKHWVCIPSRFFNNDL